MLRPSIFTDSLLDDVFEFPFYDDKADHRAERKLYGHHAANLMKTDIKEKNDSFELEIDLPGFTKDEIKVEEKNGYLTVSAAKGLDKDEQNKKGEYIRRERYAGSMSRSFYVGEHLNEEDIKAKYEDGILKLSVPKKDVKELAQNKYIAIEG